MFGPVVTTEAHPALTAMIEALSFLSPHGPVALPFRPFSLQLSCSLSNEHRDIKSILFPR